MGSSPSVMAMDFPLSLHILHLSQLSPILLGFMCLMLMVPMVATSLERGKLRLKLILSLTQLVKFLLGQLPLALLLSQSLMAVVLNCPHLSLLFLLSPMLLGSMSPILMVPMVATSLEREKLRLNLNLILLDKFLLVLLPLVLLSPPLIMVMDSPPSLPLSHLSPLSLILLDSMLPMCMVIFHTLVELQWRFLICSKNFAPK